MDNQRGLFSLVTIRTVIDKLIYQDEYENIDQNLTDCNVGARKERKLMVLSMVLSMEMMIQ